MPLTEAMPPLILSTCRLDLLPHDAPAGVLSVARSYSYPLTAHEAQGDRRRVGPHL